MSRSEILRQINNIFIETLDNENITLSEDTKATDINEWDSLAHIQIVVAIEKHYNVRFTSLEIQDWKNVGEIIDCIQKK